MLVMRILKYRIGEPPSYDDLTSKIIDYNLFFDTNEERCVEYLKSYLESIEYIEGYLDETWKKSLVERLKKDESLITHFRREIYELKIIFTHVKSGDNIDLILDLI